MGNVLTEASRSGASAAARRHRPPVAVVCAIVAAIAATLAGLPAFAAPPGACNAADVVGPALASVVNITEIAVAPDKSPEPGKPPAAHFEVFVGSGFVIDSSGIIVTNRHVIKAAAMILVTFQDRSQVTAQLIDAAKLTDIALLKVTVPKPLPTLSFGNSDVVRIGEPVIAVGNPLGVGTSVSTGVVSALNRDLMRSPFDDFIQTDASINRGNSGGPLLNCEGKVIGINSDLVSTSAALGSVGLGFAIPANVVRFVVSKLEDPSMIMPDFSGLHLQDLTAELAKVFAVPDVNGAIVAKVDDNSPAAHAALQQGDIITAVSNEPMTDSRAILRTIITSPKDAALPLSVWRNGKMSEVTLQTVPWPSMLAERSEVLANPDDLARAESVGLGMHLSSVSADDRKRFNLPDSSGILIDQVIAGSQADGMKLHVGDVIERVGLRPAASLADVTAALTPSATGPGSLVALLVRADTGMLRWTTLWLGRIDPKDLVASLPTPAENGSVHDVSARRP